MRFTAFHLLFVALLRGNDDNHAMAQSEAPTTSAATTTMAPTEVPITKAPTSGPSAAPSFAPTAPTSGPSAAPSFAPTEIPTKAPTLRPSAAPAFGPPPDCYDDLEEVFLRETEVTDTTVWREYILCPDTEYLMGTFAGSIQGKLQFAGGFTPISPRNNVHYKCGSTGRSSNKCVLFGGSFHVLGFGAQFNEVQGNVTMEGLTFESANQVTLFLGSAGDITFHDCVIKVSAILCERRKSLGLENGSPFYLFIFRKIKT
jgi:hypothetical protein